MKQVNPSANQTEEAYERISKRKEDASADASRGLFSTQNNEAEKLNSIRLTIPHVPSAGKSILKHVDMPHPKNDFCRPKEIWETLNNTKNSLGEK